MYQDEIQQLNNVLHMIGRRMQKQQLNEKYAAISNLSTVDISIMQVIADEPIIKLKQICERLALPKSTLTSAVNRLEKKGYVERIASTQDKRSYSLQLTDQGNEAQKEHMLLEYEALSGLIQNLDEPEVEMLILLLNKAIGGDRQ